MKLTLLQHKIIVIIYPAYSSAKFKRSFSLHTGRYPFHFHMCFDMRNATHPPYVRENSIHDVFSRCITVHGSHGVMVIVLSTLIS